MGNGTSLHRFNEIFKILKESGLISGVTPQKLSQTLEKLGPTFIKIGQILSTRVDLFDEEYIVELSKLRSNVKEIDFKDIQNILFEAYGNYTSIFSYVEERPIGSASIAQVHKAKLIDGQEVVLKIKRPGIDKEIVEDFELLKT